MRASRTECRCRLTRRRFTCWRMTMARMKLGEGIKFQKGPMACLAYDLSPEGAVSNHRMLIDYLPSDGGDGMTVDVDGNLYIAVRSEAAPGIHIYTPQGKELAYISTGKELPTNVAFGYGDDANLL